MMYALCWYDKSSASHENSLRNVIQVLVSVLITKIIATNK